jgi:hypothetical protein
MSIKYKRLLCSETAIFAEHLLGILYNSPEWQRYRKAHNMQSGFIPYNQKYITNLSIGLMGKQKVSGLYFHSARCKLWGPGTCC